ncbi:MAG: hypothetical protein JW999_02645 [Methanotrichaceae archaeon]|nr:hypothetical protein [Methanotrichaceae archaeon]
MSKICPLLMQPCIKNDCEMWLSSEIAKEDDSGGIGKKFYFEDCAFRIIAGRPRFLQPEEDFQDKNDDEFMTGN